MAIGFITIAIPIRLDAHWITIGWFVEAGVLLWVGNRTKSDFLNVLALIALILGVARLLLIDNFHTTQLIFNMRMATYAVAVAVLGTVAWYAAQRSDEPASTVAAVAVVALNILALIALSREVADYYSREIATVTPPFQDRGDIRPSICTATTSNATSLTLLCGWPTAHSSWSSDFSGAALLFAGRRSS